MKLRTGKREEIQQKGMRRERKTRDPHEKGEELAHPPGEKVVLPQEMEHDNRDEEAYQSLGRPCASRG